MIQAYLVQLADPDPTVRADAADTLAVLNDRKALGGLVRAIKDPDAEVRIAVCAALSALADARAIPPLVSALHDPDDDVRGEAFAAILHIGQSRASKLPDYTGEDPRAPNLALTQIVWPADLEAVKLLYETLEDPDPELRIAALYAMGRMMVMGAYDAIAKLLFNDPDPDVQVAAAFAMSDLADGFEARALPALTQAWQQLDAAQKPELAVVVARAFSNHAAHANAPGILTHALNHTDARVRQLAIMGIAEAKIPGAARYLLPCLQDPSGGVRSNAVYALGRISDPESIGHLVATVPHNEVEIRVAIATALRALDRATVRTHLTHAAQSEDIGLRHAAAYLRGQLGETEGLNTSLADPDATVRRASALAMGDSGETGFRGALEQVLNDANWQVRATGAEALRRLRVSAAIPALQACQQDPHQAVRTAVEKALGDLGAR